MQELRMIRRALVLAWLAAFPMGARAADEDLFEGEAFGRSMLAWPRAGTLISWLAGPRHGHGGRPHAEPSAHPTLNESVAMASEIYEGAITDSYVPK